jgi:two-component system cell cycle sensor histidine kinase/response regulator CckA
MMSANFIITADKIYDLQYELLSNNVSNIISNSESDYKTISALGLEKVEFYRDATKEGVVQNIEKNLTPGTSIVIFDSKSNKIAYLVGNDQLGKSITVEHINKIKSEPIGPHEYDLKLSSGESISTLMSYGFYSNWDWVIVSLVDKKQLLKYSNDAMVLSIFMVGIFLLLIFIVVFSLSHRISLAIVGLEEAAYKLSTNDVDVKIELSGNDEFTSLASSFNLMAAEIRTTELKLRNSISDEKKTNISLIKSRKQYHDLVEEMPDMITRVDVNGFLIFINKAVENVLGLPADNCIGKLAFDFVHPDDQLKTKQKIALWLASKKGTFSHENRMLNVDGQIVNIAWSIYQEYDELDNIIGFASTGRDITENKKNREEKVKLKSQLHQAQKMEAVGKLAGGIAHDFNNMLGVIIGHAELALIQSGPSSSLTSNLNGIIDAGERSAILTRQLLTYARKQTIAPKIINLNESISSILTMLRRLIDENIELSFEQGTNLGLIMIDPSQMDQILANLCVNASYAIDTFGIIAIKTEHYTADGDSSGNQLSTDKFVLPAGNYVKLSITDDGSGMDKEVIKHVFEPFYTTKEIGKGTGLGLSTVFGAVKQNEGYIEVISELNQGTQFNIYFPSKKDIKLNKKETKTVSDFFGNETVLVVEDDVMLLEIQIITLEQYGYKVLSASTCPIAEDLALEYSGQIDLLLTDVVMPNMNGKELAEKLSVCCPNMSILYMSGYTADIIANKGIIYENTHFIQKPFGSHELASKVREVLGELST